MEKAEGNGRKGARTQPTGIILAWLPRSACCLLVAALWLGAPIPARAQFLPTNCPPPAMPEPMPMGAAPNQPPLPGNPPPLMDSTMTLGGERSNAWGTDECFDNGPVTSFGEGCAWYVTIGSNALRRQNLGHARIAVLDPQNIDTGIPPPLNAPVAFDAQSLNPVYAWGVIATVGYRWNDYNAVELTGFYIPEQNASREVRRPGRLDQPFFNPPLGFEGDNGMWLQDDRIRITSSTALANAEFNYRCTPCPGYGLDLIAGVRYFDLHDRFTNFTDDDGLTVNPPDPFRMATYSVHTHNHILAPQLGIDWEVPVRRWVAFGFFAKGAWGINWFDVDVTLQRGDGFLGPSGHRNDRQFSQIYEGGFFLDWFLNDRIRLRTGYNIMWALNVAEAIDEVDFDLSHHAGRVKDDGDIFYHGPVVEFHLLF
jgi:hypothetical protein